MRKVVLVRSNPCNSSCLNPSRYLYCSTVGKSSRSKIWENRENSGHWAPFTNTCYRYLDACRHSTQTVDLMGQQAITKDNISVVIDAVVFMQVEDPESLILNIQDYRIAVNKYAQSAIRNIIGTYDLDDLLESREEVASQLKEEIDLLVKDWVLI